MLATDGTALILLSLLLSHLRNALRPSSILVALDMLLSLSLHLCDETKLDRLVPYFVSLLEDDAALVRIGAIRSLTQLASLANVVYRACLLMYVQLGSS